ncbi:MAG: hypothetical protein DRP26_05625 [Candidatus Zixiibacteriota bacterium]|nr:MAG: hypothetical protein DRP26_05625 [candidate division Zixibacteria bacterium]
MSCCVGAGESGEEDIGALGIGCGQPIPALSEWGLIILALLLLAIGTISIIRSRSKILSEENNRNKKGLSSDSPFNPNNACFKSYPRR